MINFEFGEIMMHPCTMLSIILALDLLFGDPLYSLHPVRIIGKLLNCYENMLEKIDINDRVGGIFLVFLLLFSSLGICLCIFFSLSFIHWSLGWLWYLYLGWSSLALRDLIKHAKNVSAAMKEEDIDLTKYHVGMLVGRDTKQMDFQACG